jgi:ion channel POLLUX/CASTOR
MGPYALHVPEGQTRRITLGDRLRYAFDNTMSRGTPALVGWLAVATFALILLFSAGTLLTGLRKSDEPGFIRQLFDSSLHALDPGTVAGDTGSWQFLLTMLLLTLGGLFIVSALIGVIATGLDRKIEELRKGRSFVIERGHTLILGWSHTVFTILGELAIANESVKKPVVVILADKDRVEMEDLIRVKVEDLRGTRVICRSGNPIDLSDLEIVNPQNAGSVIVLGPDGDDEPDAHVIKSILALTKGPTRREEPYEIVAEIADPQNLEAARLVAGGEAAIIDKRSMIARLIVQASRQSGASVVYTELLDFEGDEIYFRVDPALTGRTYADALLAYEDCTLIGLQFGDGRIKLNPPGDTRLGERDAVIAIAEDDARLAAAPPPSAEPDPDAMNEPVPVAVTPRNVLLLGWNGRAPAVINELDQYVPAGSKLTVVASIEAAADTLRRECGAASNLELDFKTGNTSDRRTLESLGVGGYDQVIVLCYSDVLDAQRADARTLVTLLHLRDMASQNGSFSIVSELLDDRNRQLAQVTRVDDVIVSDRILSLMLTQMSENPDLEDVFAELFSAEGSELYMRPAAGYVKAGHPTTFATVVASAARRGETAIGVRHGEHATDPEKGYGVVVNPLKSEPLTLCADDRVIVLAEE